ncbi:hypothetical protein [Lysinibacter cavernae]|uniref:Cell division protein FtsL n=1 Tax=Lysinibacter cavernae TaxID=1640652 RepID=A0A7X5TSJ6_9MICO|nr:hypothetical protein [Lysinibacter cavernae]NIH53095.1 hypothetical protein [Lysinibacter cavernae]
MSNNTAPIDSSDFWAFDPATPWQGTPTPDEQPGRLRAVRERALSIAPAPRAKTRTSMFYALITLATLGVILGTQLMLSIAQADGAYHISSLEVQERDLIRDTRAVTQSVSKLSSPQHLSGNANALGMVINAHPAYLRLSDGAILGALGTTVSTPEANRIANSVINGLPMAGAVAPETSAQNNANVAAEAEAADAANAAAIAAAAVAEANAAESDAANADHGTPAATPVQTPQQTVPLDGALPSPVTR